MYTSNVDGHFLAAGFNEQRICEVHGRVSKWISLTEDDGDVTMLPDGHRFSVDETDMRLLGDEQDPESLRAAGVPVDKHGNMMRPAVLMFDDEPEHLLKHLKVDQDKYQVWEVKQWSRGGHGVVMMGHRQRWKRNWSTTNFLGW